MLIKQKDPRFRHLEFKTGILVSLAIIGIIVILVFIGIEKDLFTKKYRIAFVTASGTGFVEGMPVKLSGFKIGRVKDIDLTEEARVRVIAEINKRYEQWIRTGSEAHLAKEGFIGDAYVEITVGDPDARMIGDNETIPYVKAGGIEELVEEAKPILQEVKEIIHYVNSPEGDIKVMLGNIKDLTSDMKQTQRSIDSTIVEAGALMKNADKLITNLNEKSSIVLDNANKTMSRVEPIMERVEGITIKVDAATANLPATMEKVGRIVDDVSLLTDTLSKETPRIREILMNADSAVRDGRIIAKGVKESWPVRLMVPPRKEPGLVPLDSYLFKKPSKPASGRTE